MKYWKLGILGFLLISITICVFLYLKPVDINREYSSVAYSFDNDFEKKTTIILRGELYRRLFDKPTVIGNARTLGTINASYNLDKVWLKLNDIDKKYNMNGYVFGPASTKIEANELIRELVN
ncbi:hypothetical protein PaeBR_05145 [Paenibacillus sp. BR2-3]|uniref:hypothetical protein n=1 Tax=Paenibacillus sp. BR2-3 TaxID=3048494 RepID=UPI0039778517